VLGRVDGADGRVLGRLGVGVARSDGRCGDPVVGDDGRAGLTMRGSCEPLLGAAGAAPPEVVGGVRTGSLELGVAGLRCSVGRGASCGDDGCGERRRAAADGDSTPGASLYSASMRGGGGRVRMSGR